jgi:AraC family transcriptional regulator
MRPHGVVPEDYRVVEAGPVHLVNMNPPAGAVVDPPVPDWAVHLVLETPPLLQVGFNRPPRWLVMSPGVFLVAPPDTAGDFVSDGTSHVLTLAIPKARAAEFMEDTGTRIEVRREETFRAPALSDRIVRLWHAVAHGARGSRLFADEVMRESLGVLAQRTETAGPARHARERLPSHTLRRLRDFVESSLASDLDVAAMADVAGMSPAHFARAFAATAGRTPCEYVMTRRLDRARQLLERTDRSALQIALEVGFKTPSHFASRFRREYGVSPREVRRRPSALVPGASRF